MALINLEEFHILRNDRSVHGEGVALYIPKSLSATIIYEFSTAGCSGMLEYLMCEEIKPESLPVFVAVVYRPPHRAFTTPVDLGAQLSLAMDKYPHKVILETSMLINSAPASTPPTSGRSGVIYHSNSSITASHTSQAPRRHGSTFAWSMSQTQSLLGANHPRPEELVIPSSQSTLTAWVYVLLPKSSQPGDSRNWLALRLQTPSALWIGLIS